MTLVYNQWTTFNTVYKDTSSPTYQITEKLCNLLTKIKLLYIYVVYVYFCYLCMKYGLLVAAISGWIMS